MQTYTSELPPASLACVVVMLLQQCSLAAWIQLCVKQAPRVLDAHCTYKSLENTSQMQPYHLNYGFANTT